MSVANTQFSTFVLPISGVDFVRYIAFFSLLSDYNIKPNVIYSASGGCLASYLAMMSGFTKSVESWKINSDMFISKASPFTMRLMTFATRGFLYHRPNIIDYVRKLFVPAKIQNVEIISGHYDSNQRINVIDTNFPKEKSILQNINLNSIAMKDTTISFTDQVDATNYERVVEEVIRKIEKTTNIPLFLEPQGKSKAIDFGVVSLSPRAMVCATMDKSIYFSPINIDNNMFNGDYDMFFHKMVMQDIIQIKSIFANESYFQNFQQVLWFIQSKTRYCLVLYSATSVNLVIESFSSSDASTSAQSCKKTIKFYLFFD